MAGTTAVAFALAGVLGGCTGGSQADPPSPPTTSPTSAATSPAPVVTPTQVPTPTATTPAATPGPKAPVKPKGMNANTAEGARKTALYFIQLYPYVLATGDVMEFDRIVIPGKGGCKFCDSTRSDALRYKKKHWNYVGGAISAEVVKTYLYDELFGAYPMDIRVHEKPSIVRDANGKQVDSGDGGSPLMRFEVIRAGKVWKILTVATLKDE